MPGFQDSEAAMIEAYVTRFRELRVNSYPRSVPSLHKPCMLLAVLELADRGALARNEIRYARPLLTAYERYYRTVEDPTRPPGAFYPFFHLKGDGFWHLHPRPRRDDDLAKMRRAGSKRKVAANIDHVDRQFAAAGPDRLWVADLTSVPTWAGFLSLAVGLDVWSRRLVGWSMEPHLKTERVLRALNMALAQRCPEDRHPPRGSRLSRHQLRVRQALSRSRCDAVDGVDR